MSDWFEFIKLIRLKMVNCFNEGWRMKDLWWLFRIDCSSLLWLDSYLELLFNVVGVMKQITFLIILNPAHHVIDFIDWHIFISSLFSFYHWLCCYLFWNFTLKLSILSNFLFIDILYHELCFIWTCQKLHSWII